MCLRPSIKGVVCLCGVYVVYGRRWVENAYTAQTSQGDEVLLVLMSGVLQLVYICSTTSYTSNTTVQ